MRLFLIYLTVLNLTGFLMMGIDKEKARRHAWRIPERTFFLCSIFGGSIGTWAGMYTFRHKTRHWYFVFGMPMICLLWVAGLFYIVK